MVNYYDNDADTENYIVNYKIKKDELVIKHVGGKKYSIPNSTEAEQAILDKMELQIHSFEKHISCFEHDKLKNILYGIFVLLVSVASIPIMSHLIIPLIGIAFSQLFFITSMYIQKELNEYQKDVFIIRNKVLLNKNKDKDQVKSKLNDITQKKIEKTEDININTVSKFTLKELNDLKDSINRCKQQQSFEGTDILNNGRQYTL